MMPRLPVSVPLARLPALLVLLLLLACPAEAAPGRVVGIVGDFEGSNSRYAIYRGDEKLTPLLFQEVFEDDAVEVTGRKGFISIEKTDGTVQTVRKADGRVAITRPQRDVSLFDGVLKVLSGMLTNRKVYAETSLAARAPGGPLRFGICGLAAGRAEMAPQADLVLAWNGEPGEYRVMLRGGAVRETAMVDGLVAEFSGIYLKPGIYSVDIRRLGGAQPESLSGAFRVVPDPARPGTSQAPRDWMQPQSRAAIAAGDLLTATGGQWALQALQDLAPYRTTKTPAGLLFQAIASGEDGGVWPCAD